MKSMEEMFPDLEKHLYAKAKETIAQQRGVLGKTDFNDLGLESDEVNEAVRQIKYLKGKRTVVMTSKNAGEVAKRTGVSKSKRRVLGRKQSRKLKRRSASKFRKAARLRKKSMRKRGNKKNSQVVKKAIKTRRVGIRKR